MVAGYGLLISSFPPDVPLVGVPANGAATDLPDGWADVTSEQLHWIWWVGGSAVTLIGLALLVWALFADKARGRRRCPKCWYDLSHTAGMRCSECGHEPRKEKWLFRTRRRWKWAFAGVVVLVLSPSALGWRFAQRDWITHGPDTLLIASLFWIDDPSEVLDELNARLSGRYLSQPTPCDGCICGCRLARKYPIPWNDELWDWQWWLLAKQLSDIVEARTPGERSAWWIMRGIPDKRLIDEAIISGLRDPNPKAFEYAIEVCYQIDRKDELNDELITAFAEALPRTGGRNFDLLFRLIAAHSEHASAALPILLRDVPDLCRPPAGYEARTWDGMVEAADASQYLLMIVDFTRKTDNHDTTIGVIRSIFASPETNELARIAAVQAMLVLAPEEGVDLLSHLEQRDRREVLRFTMQEHPELATTITDLCMHHVDARLGEDAAYAGVPEYTPMDCFLELLGDIEVVNAMPPTYDAESGDKGGLLGGMRDARALNALPHESRPGAENLGGVLFMFRQIRELSPEVPVRDATGNLVMPARKGD